MPRRADRRDSNYDNALNHPRSRIQEPATIKELTQRLGTVQSQRDEWQQKAKEYEAAAGQLIQVENQLVTVQSEVVQWHEQSNRNYQLYQEEQKRYTEADTQRQYYLTLYQEEQQKYNEAESQRQHYLTLYTETLSELQFERRSKAGIKGWETRRRRENERLKKEIGEMALLLQDSLARKEAALENLELLAGRMDRIQQLVDSVEAEPATTPRSLFQKLKRIWMAIKEILAE